MNSVWDMFQTLNISQPSYKIQKNKKTSLCMQEGEASQYLRLQCVIQQDKGISKPTDLTTGYLIKQNGINLS